MGINVVEHVELFRDPERFCGNPNVERLSNGNLLLGFRWSDGRLRGDWDPSVRPVQMNASSVEALAQTEPRVIHDADSTLTPYTKQLSDDTLLCAVNRWRVVGESEVARFPGYERVEAGTGVAALPAPILILRSDDAAESWQPYADVGPEEGFGPGLGFRGNILELANGDLLFPVWGRLRPPEIAATSILMRSTDRGATWHKLATIADDATSTVGFNETFVHQTDRGELVAFLRTSGADGNLFTARSDDNGLNWSRPVDSHVYGFPHWATRLSDGRVLLTYGARQEPYGTRARLLHSDCEEIAGAEEVIIRGDGSNGAVGYPAAVEIEDNVVLVVYYHRTGEELSWIGGSVVEIT